MTIESELEPIEKELDNMEERRTIFYAQKLFEARNIWIKYRQQGGFKRWCEKRKIDRSTAYKLVKAYEREVNLPTEIRRLFREVNLPTRTWAFLMTKADDDITIIFYSLNGIKTHY